MRTTILTVTLLVVLAAEAAPGDEAAPADGQPRLVIQTGHGGSRAVAFSPDGKRVLSGGDDQCDRDALPPSAPSR